MHYIGPYLHIFLTDAEWYTTDNEERFALFQRFVNKDRQIDTDWRYEFNDNGFRGADIDASANLKVIFSGCGFTFGVGVAGEHTWTTLFENGIKAHQNHLSVSSLNVSQGQAPNDYVSRAALEACATHEPQLVIYQVAPIFRKEHVHDYLPNEEVDIEFLNHVQHIGPWRTDMDGLKYYNFFTQKDGMVNAIKNMLLVQYYCQRRNIQLIFTPYDSGMFSQESLTTSAIAQDLWAQVDQSLITDFSITDEDIFTDLGRDYEHPGIASHQKFAERMLSFYKAKYASQPKEAMESVS